MAPDPKPQLIVIDDEPAAIELIRLTLESRLLQVVGFTNPVLGLNRIAQDRPDMVLLDLNMPELSGLEVLEQIVDVSPATEVILITGDYSTETAVRAIQMGASDYWTKPLDLDRLSDRIDAWLEDRGKIRERLKLDSELTHAYEFHGMVGRSPQLMEMFTKVRRIAAHFKTALVTGETGSGKELVAKALHKLSPRGGRSLLVCNCAGLVNSIVESELFGYVKGAFTGATHDRSGLIEASDMGTLFLDEVGELPLATQAMLLRVLENRELRRVGATSSRMVDVHIIAATNRDLRRMVEQGSFREDLYYRLAMVELHVPSLSDRREDLRLLLQTFLERYAKEFSKPGLALTRRAELLMTRYSWPGNIRELQQVIASSAMAVAGALIDVNDLPETIQQQSMRLESRDDLLSLSKMEYLYAKRVLTKVGGNHKKAAEVLEIGRSTLYRLLRRVGVSDDGVLKVGSKMLGPVEDEIALPTRR